MSDETDDFNRMEQDRRNREAVRREPDRVVVPPGVMRAATAGPWGGAPQHAARYAESTGPDFGAELTRMTAELVGDLMLTISAPPRWFWKELKQRHALLVRHRDHLVPYASIATMVALALAVTAILTAQRAGGRLEEPLTAASSGQPPVGGSLAQPQGLKVVVGGDVGAEHRGLGGAHEGLAPQVHKLTLVTRTSANDATRPEQADARLLEITALTAQWDHHHNGGTAYAIGEQYLLPGAARDLGEANWWIRRAATLHNGPAEFELAKMYLAGEGERPNRDTACVYLGRAARDGVAYARTQEVQESCGQSDPFPATRASAVSVTQSDVPF